ncbi:acyltransferase family protein [Microbacterium ureisolvens]|uniref:Acyltransferase n=1 Tax=Microbacterium ureisolvens TaxID=2781186 RepID=A0ABS7I2H5_9MICO|nr:acyltransferase family protein [Microbacterium ureisolvens]MBW9111864.1 acyltransferase [Microbacterium ureisolvens]
MTVAEAVSTRRVDRQNRTRTFLPEVQALRAVAVLLVVVYHLYPGRLPGGFVGVDVFFAISGFLITSHLVASLLPSGAMRPARFWANRIWRLLPASLLVLAVCWVFTLLYAPTTVATDTFKQIGAASAYVENWVLANDAVDYLARDNAPTLVQHYWSLSVEEQFYILWPLLLMGTTVIAGVLAIRRGQARRSRVSIRALWIVMASVVIGSGIYSVAATRFAPAHAYFDTFTRAWEFALGGVLALAVATFPQVIEKFRSHPLVERLGVPLILGLLMILASGLLMDSSTPFPSGWAAVPVVGTLLVIAGGLPRLRPIAQAVQWRPVQVLGDISYSLYLWHWPLIIGFAMVTARRHTSLEGIIIFAIAVALAWITKLSVEDPIRRLGRRARPVWPAFALALIGAVVLISLSVAVVSHREGTAAEEAAAREQAVTDQSGCLGANAVLGASDCPEPYQLTPGVDPVLPYTDLDPEWCLTWFDEDWRSCALGDEAATNGTVAIVGDSHAAALTNPLGEYLASAGMRLETFTRFGCPAMSEQAIGLHQQTPEMEQACADWTRRVTDHLISRDDISTVVYTSYEWGYTELTKPDMPALTSDDIVSTLSRVADSGKQVVLMHDFPATGQREVPTCVAQSADPAVECSQPLSVAYVKGPYTEAAAALGPRIRVVSPQEATCDADRCYGLVGDVVVYADDNHVSETFARSLMRYLGPALMDGKPLTDPHSGG